MNSELQTQTDLLLKSESRIHDDLGAIDVTLIIGLSVIAAILLVVAFRRR